MVNPTGNARLIPVVLAVLGVLLSGCNPASRHYAKAKKHEEALELRLASDELVRALELDSDHAKSRQLLERIGSHVYDRQIEHSVHLGLEGATIASYDVYLDGIRYRSQLRELGIPIPARDVSRDVAVLWDQIGSVFSEAAGRQFDIGSFSDVIEIVEAGRRFFSVDSAQNTTLMKDAFDAMSGVFDLAEAIDPNLPVEDLFREEPPKVFTWPDLPALLSPVLAASETGSVADIGGQFAEIAVDSRSEWTPGRPIRVIDLNGLVKAKGIIVSVADRAVTIQFDDTPIEIGPTDLVVLK